MDRNAPPQMPRDELYSLLQELTTDEFKEFRLFLQDGPGDGEQSRISRGLLENADQLKTAELMITYHGPQLSFIIAEQLLTKLSRMDLVQRLLRYHRNKYKAFIADKFRVMDENVSRSGEYIHLKERYTELLMIKNHRDREKREEEIKSTGLKQSTTFDERAKYSYASIKDVFEADEHGHLPRTVVLQGPAGIGKTMTARKIMLDWATGERFQGKFSYVFYINCREINQFDREPTLADLMFPSCHEIHLPMGDIEAEQEKILFILDGFDQLALPKNVPLKPPAKKAKLDNTIQSLIRKTCFSRSYILMTTRPTALERLREWLEVSRFAEILGFSEKNKEAYFIKFFRDETKGKEALEAVAENETLYTMCFMPMVCWIVCTVLSEQLEKSGDFVSALKPTASFYMFFLYNLLKIQYSDSELPNITMHLKKLCALANEGIFNQKLLFEESDIVRHSLTSPEIQSLFLKNEIFIKDAKIEKLSSFTHLSFQEFLAALFYILQDNENESEPTLDPVKRVKNLLEAYRKNEQHHLMLTVRFLFGLHNAEILSQMENIYKLQISADIKCTLQQWLMDEIGYSIEEKEKNLLHCLLEIRDEEFTKQAVKSLEFVELTQKTSFIRNKMDIMALTFCIKNAPGIQVILIDGYNMKPVDVRKLLPSLTKCSTLRLQDCSLTDSSCPDLSSFLLQSSSLTDLDLEGNDFGDSGVKLLCEGLKHSSCKLENLILGFCNLNPSCCTYISSLLQTNVTLKELELGFNYLTDSGVAMLCEGLNESSCKIQNLSINDCTLTGISCAHLASVLQMNTCLQELDLSGNELENSGVVKLCEGLKHPSCKLQSLNLSKTRLTNDCTEALCSALRGNTTLEKIDLRENKFTSDAEFKALMEARPGLTVKLSNPPPPADGSLSDFSRKDGSCPEVQSSEKYTRLTQQLAARSMSRVRKELRQRSQTEDSSEDSSEDSQAE